MKFHVGSVHRQSMSSHFLLPGSWANKAFLPPKYVDSSKLKFTTRHRALLQTQDKISCIFALQLRRRNMPPASYKGDEPEFEHRRIAHARKFGSPFSLMW
jgi:hypothetical protein